MFELDGDFDLDENFLQGVFETENEVTNKITRIEEKGEKRSTLEEIPCLAAKKHKSSNNVRSSSQIGNTSLFGGRVEVVENNTKNNETESNTMRSDICKQASFGMPKYDTCSASSRNYTDRSTPDTYKSKVGMHSDGRYGLCGENIFKGMMGTCATRQRNRVVPTDGQRKFPGPAGLLPDKEQVINQSTVHPPITDSEILHMKSSDSVFESAAWLQMLKDFEMTDTSGPLSQFTVAWVKRRASARQLVDQKVPFLVTVLRELDCSSLDPCVILRDRTGTVKFQEREEESMWKS